MTGLCFEGHSHLAQNKRDLDGIAMRMRANHIEEERDNEEERDTEEERDQQAGCIIMFGVWTFLKHPRSNMFQASVLTELKWSGPLTRM